MYWNWYIPVMNVRLLYYGTNSVYQQKYPNNKPDITIRDNKQFICMSTDVAIRADRNVNKKEAEMVL